MEYNELTRTTCRQVVLRVLAGQGWQLVDDQEAFIEEVLAEVQLRLTFISPAERERRSLEKVIGEATVNRYNHLWHAACAENATWRQRQAFTELFAYLYPIALFRANYDVRIAEEATQEGLVIIWQNLSKVRDPGSFVRWCGVIVSREVSKALKKVLSPPDNGPDEPETKLLSTENTPPPTYVEDIREQVKEIIKRCLGRSRNQPKVIFKMFFEEKSVQEIADELGMKASNVYLLKHNALKRLQECTEFLRWSQSSL